MTDDILGIWGDPEQTGKPAGSDIVRRKKTLPVVYALERSPSFCDLYGDGGNPEANVDVVLDMLEGLEARDHVERLADEYKQRALEELEQTGLRNEAQDRLRELARSLTVRSY
jgi:geranylgeranyl diphosphate synthase type I